MESLFKGIQENKKIEWEFFAAINGVDLGTGTETKTAPVVQDSDTSIPLFGDPSDYQSMSLEERQEQTDKMQSKHKSWAGQSFLKGK